MDGGWINFEEIDVDKIMTLLARWRDKEILPELYPDLVRETDIALGRIKIVDNQND